MDDLEETTSEERGSDCCELSFPENRVCGSRSQGEGGSSRAQAARDHIEDQSTIYLSMAVRWAKRTRRSDDDLSCRANTGSMRMGRTGCSPY